MCALTAKVIAMLILGYNVIPVIFFIPTFNLVTVISTIAILKNINETQTGVRNTVPKSNFNSHISKIKQRVK